MSTTLPFPVFGLEEAEIESFIDNYEILKKKFQATFREPIKLDIEKFHSSKEYVSCEIRESIELSLNLTECFVHYVDVEYEHIGSKGARYRSTEFHCWGSVVLKKDFGHVLIKHETLSDKIQDFIRPIELDFPEDKLFSKKFYVLASDKLKAEMAISASFRELLLSLEQNDLFVEIIGQQLIIGNRKLMEPEDTLQIATFISKVSKI